MKQDVRREECITVSGACKETGEFVPNQLRSLVHDTGVEICCALRDLSVLSLENISASWQRASYEHSPGTESPDVWDATIKINLHVDLLPSDKIIKIKIHWSMHDLGKYHNVAITNKIEQIEDDVINRFNSIHEDIDITDLETRNRIIRQVVLCFVDHIQNRIIINLGSVLRLDDEKMMKYKADFNT